MGGAPGRDPRRWVRRARGGPGPRRGAGARPRARPPEPPPVPAAPLSGGDRGLVARRDRLAHPADPAAARERDRPAGRGHRRRSEEHTSELQSHVNLVCRLLLEKKKKKKLKLIITKKKKKIKK